MLNVLQNWIFSKKKVRKKIDLCCVNDEFIKKKSCEIFVGAEFYYELI